MKSKTGPAALRRRLPLALMLAAAIGTPGCRASQPESYKAGADVEAARDKVSGRERFAQSLAARANRYCRCRPPLPPRFPQGEDENAVRRCVAQQATQLLEDSLGPVTIQGPRPAIDVAQIQSLSTYLESRHVPRPHAGPCDLSTWMVAVERAAKGTASSGTVVNTPVMRVDRRHPTQWSDIGFMSASKASHLGIEAEPSQHFGWDMYGSQVWVSTSVAMSGIQAVLEFQLESQETSDLCIAYQQRTHEFKALRSHPACTWQHAHSGPDIVIPLVIDYVYRSGEGVDVYRPDEHNFDTTEDEEEALSLGFRPNLYRGVIGLYDSQLIEQRVMYTREFAIEYGPRGCEGLTRPAFSETSPFEGLRDVRVRSTPGVDCWGGQYACAECLTLTAPASSCLLVSGSFP